MKGGASKAWTRRSRVKLSKTLQETLLGAVESNADTQQHGIEDKKTEQAGELVQTTLQQPKPNPLKRPYASFLKDFVDPVHTGSCPASIHTFVSDWLESVGSDREKHCRSDSYLQHSDDDPFSRQATRSVPEMGCIRDADGFAVSLMPDPTGSRSYRASYAGSVAPSDSPGSGRSSGRNLVEDPFYRVMNLAANNIYMRSSREQFPEHVADLVELVRRDRESPGPSPDQVWQDRALEKLGMGAAKPEVENYFQTRMLPHYKPGDALVRTDRQPMVKHTVPSTGSKLKASNPVPDTLYGYSFEGFPQQQAQLISMGTETMANNQGLIYPFFVIEFMGDGPSGSGSLWAAMNHCLGGSTSCVNIAERLNNQLRKCKSKKIRQINSAAFSVAMSSRGTTLRHMEAYRSGLLHGECQEFLASRA